MHPDVSVILNIHRESGYVLRTLRSLDEAASFARHEGIHSELIVVLDRTDELTRNVTKSAICCGFETVRYVEADHGSLGLARNTGIATANGKYVWTADADDLVSYNCIAAMHAMAEATPGSVVFPEYLVGFGDDHWVGKYFDDSVVEAADFIYGHPYISRIFQRRAVFKDLQSADVRLSPSFAHEDWHLNCEFKARGLRFSVAPKTVIYYRQRKGSLCREADTISTRQIPATSLFRPEILLSHVALEKARHTASLPRASKMGINHSISTQEFLADPVCMELTFAAIRIDPCINLRLIEAGRSGANVFPEHHWGHDYAKACSLVGTGAFSDVVLLPGLNSGEGERFVLDVLHSLAEETESFRCLIISGEAATAHEWVDRLPYGSVFLDVFNEFPGFDDNARDQLVLRLVLAVGEKFARIHLQDSSFVRRWYSRFSPCLDGFKSVYYRSCDPRIWRNGSWVTLGNGLEFISSELGRLSMLITDNHKTIKDDVSIFGVGTEKWQCVHAAVPTHSPDQPPRSAPVHKILWASRLCQQKRPDLLAKIAAEASRMMPALRICAVGSSDLERDWPALFADTPGLEYLGPFQEFAALQPDGYDALLYTTAFDGLPNVILEAMGWGLPVIAPDVGGVSEAVRDGETGYLVPNHGEDGQLIEAYVAAIQRLYSDWERTRSMADAARRLIERRHNTAVHRERVRQLFQASEKS
jgi:glycosyltransferase involved in cell wall biosynthesis